MSELELQLLRFLEMASPSSPRKKKCVTKTCCHAKIGKSLTGFKAARCQKEKSRGEWWLGSGTRILVQKVGDGDIEPICVVMREI